MPTKSYERMKLLRWFVNVKVTARLLKLQRDREELSWTFQQWCQLEVAFILAWLVLDLPFAGYFIHILCPQHDHVFHERYTDHFTVNIAEMLTHARAMDLFHVTSQAFHVHTNWQFWCTAATYENIGRAWTWSDFIPALELMAFALKYILYR